MFPPRALLVGVFSHFVVLPVVGWMVGHVALMLGVPVAIGMVVRRRWPVGAQRFEPLATRTATVLHDDAMAIPGALYGVLM